MAMPNEMEMLIREIKDIGIKDSRVLKAMSSVDRKIFMPEKTREYAYSNIPQSIGYGQTISQPYTVAFMDELLDIHLGHKILEIGAGSGYNAAIMSYLAGNKGKIFSVEIVKELVKVSKENLKAAGIENVKVIYGDGYFGYEDEAPYDRVIVTAAADDVPKPLMDQLKANGVMVIPLNDDYFRAQRMTRIAKRKGIPVITEHGFFSFVPFKRSSK
jgi:protein-L-isoaspartate(D-aspartate) O-methyltransferase